MLNLTAAHRRALRARAHTLKPVVWVGSQGLTKSVLQEVAKGLKSHELVKVKMSDDEREVRNELLEKICQELDAAPVQHIGKILILYRPRPKKTASDLPESREKRMRKAPGTQRIRSRKPR